MKESTFEKYKRVIDEWLVNGENGTKAYQSVYLKSTANTADKGFREIHGNPRIQNYIQEQKRIKSEQVKKEHGVTFETQIERFKAIQEIVDKFIRLLVKLDRSQREEEEMKQLREGLKVLNPTKYEEMLNKIIGAYGEHNKQKVDNEKQYYIIGGQRIEF